MCWDTAKRKETQVRVAPACVEIFRNADTSFYFILMQVAPFPRGDSVAGADDRVVISLMRRNR